MENTDCLLKLKGTVEIFKGNSDNAANKVLEVNNLLVNVGKYKILERFCGIEPNAFEYIAVGSDATAAAVGQTALLSELARVISTVVRTGTSLAITSVFLAGTGTGTWNETGIFNAVAAGSMSNRAALTIPIVKLIGDDYTVKWTLTI